ncbi:MAG TPA: TOBE domain-containing protein, partial [Brevundimonas sp.]|nr:TOBE domain-containing protein [Brevundimonas sp.]
LGGGAEEAAELGFRPEHAALAENGPIQGHVLAAEHLGSDTYAYVEVEGAERPLLVRLPGERAVVPGAATAIRPDPARVHLFDAAGRAILRAGARLMEGVA